MNILWYSTAPWSPSSYSVLTARTVPDIVKAGHIVAVGTWYGLQGQPLPWTVRDFDGPPVMVFPSGDGPSFSQDVMIPLYNYTKSNVLITCSDIWPFDPQLTGQTIFCPWLPVDMDPTPPPVLTSLESATYPMVMSKWGAEVLTDSGVKCTHVPASAPSKVFKPGPKAAAREALGFPKDAFVVSIVGANKDPQDRKGLRAGLQAFAKFHQRHENSRLYLHTRFDGAIPIGDTLKLLGLTGEDGDSPVITVDPLGYKLGLLDAGYMASVYQASDVLLNLSLSEGFGLPIVEAQMCGCPVIASDFSTTDELLFAGWKVAGQPDIAVGMNSFRLAADIGQAVDALEAALADRDSTSLANKARLGAVAYDTERVYRKYWRPALAAIEKLTEAGK